MNILLINHYAGSPYHGMEYRTYYLAREWIRLGHRVRIVASARSHVRTRAPELNGRDRLDEVIDGIHYTWFKTPHYVSNGIWRVRNMASFVWRLFAESRAIVKEFKPDVVIASSTYPMDIWPAKRIAKLAGAKLIFEVHDLWPLSPMELGGMSKWHPFIMLVQAAESYAYRTVDAVVSMLPKVHDYMQSRGLTLDKLHIVPNGIDPAEWLAEGPALAPAMRDQLAQIKAKGLSIVGYAGTHGIANAMDLLLEAAALMKDEKVAFVLVGGGPSKDELHQQAQALGLQNVWFFDAVKKEQIPALLEWFDIAYIGSHRQAMYRFGISPNKLMDYMMARRPILLAIEAGNDPVGDADCGLTVASEDPVSIVRGIRTLLAEPEDARRRMGQRGRQFVLDNHTYAVLAERFVAAFR